MDMLKEKKMGLAKGFTLIELLLVIGIIATLAVVTFVALDPAKRFQDARDARRVSDVEAILSAVHQYIIDQKGTIPAGITETEQVIGTTGTGCVIVEGGCAGLDCVNLAGDLVKYLKNMPYDPQDGTAEITQYSIAKDVNGIVTVSACRAEGSAISSSR